MQDQQKFLRSKVKVASSSACSILSTASESISSTTTDYNPNTSTVFWINLNTSHILLTVKLILRTWHYDDCPSFVKILHFLCCFSCKCINWGWQVWDMVVYSFVWWNKYVHLWGKLFMNVCLGRAERSYLSLDEPGFILHDDQWWVGITHVLNLGKFLEAFSMWLGKPTM